VSNEDSPAGRDPNDFILKPKVDTGRVREPPKLVLKDSAIDHHGFRSIGVKLDGIVLWNVKASRLDGAQDAVLRYT
jgi:hypothetical protein